jgi:hypothetical protein
MRTVRLVHGSRTLFALGLVGVLGFAGGCDSGSGTRESTVTPTTPPPGRSGEDIKNAMQKGLGTAGVPGKPATPK